MTSASWFRTVVALVLIAFVFHGAVQLVLWGLVGAAVLYKVAFVHWIEKPATPVH